MKEKKTLLIVDDIPDNIDILNGILNPLYKIKVATKGEMALRIVFSDTPPDLILLDVMMPEMDGYEVCKRIKSNEKTENIPIIFITAKDTDADELRGLEAGAVDYLAKPVNAPIVKARVKTHLELKTQREELETLNLLLEEKVRERTKQLQEANQELLGLNEAKDSFINLISHEIRTPLNGICGFTTILENSLKGSEYSEYIENLALSAKRLEEFSEKALLITKLKTGKYDFHIDTAPVADIVEKTFDCYRGKAMEKEVKLEKKIVPDDLNMFADLSLMSICMESIIDNAIKYSNQGETVFINAFKTGHKIIIEVLDKGKNLTQQARKNLFKPFSPGEQHIDQNIGLSLSIAKIIMDFHKGEIQIEDGADEQISVRLIFSL